MTNKTACQMIAEAIKDETHGKKFYGRLSKKLPVKGGKKTVSGIGKQEGRHKKKLKRLQKKLC